MGIEKKYYFSLGGGARNVDAQQTPTHESDETNHHPFTNSEECNDGFLKEYASAPDAPTLAAQDESAGGALSAPDHAGEPEDAPGYARAHEGTPDHAEAPEDASDHAGASSGALAIAEDHPALTPTPCGPAVLPEDATPGSLIDDWYRSQEYTGAPRPEFSDGVSVAPVPLHVPRKRLPTSEPSCA